jgi:hypothetical protein
MRSTNKRSRSKPNRPKSLGNIVNRVFDSSGPEGKVRGTPQQIIEKYQVLARDAQLSNDRVAAENFQQHAEHYTRMLAQAQREMQAEQDARRQQQDDRTRQQDDRNRPQHDDRQRNGQQEDRGQHSARRHDNRRPSEDTPQPHVQGYASNTAQDNGSQSAFAVQDMTQDSDEATLVETPESKSSHTAPVAQDRVPSEQAQTDAPKPANRRKPRVAKQPEDTGADADVPKPQATEGEEKPKPRRAPRKPRKPASEDTNTSSSTVE